MTAKQELFVQEYLLDLNATQAAIRADYSPRTAGKIGFENLQKPEIQELIQDAQQQRSIRMAITQDRVLAELALIGLSDMAAYLHFQQNGQVVFDWSDLT